MFLGSCFLDVYGILEKRKGHHMFKGPNSRLWINRTILFYSLSF